MLNILVGAVALFVFGALWYTVIAGKYWAKLMGFTPEKMEAGKVEGGMTKSLIFNFILNIVIAWAIYNIYPQLLSLTFFDFWKTLFVVWLGFAFPIYVNQVLWEAKSWQLLLLNSVHSVIFYTIIGAIVYYWPM